LSYQVATASRLMAHFHGVPLLVPLLVGGLAASIGKPGQRCHPV